MGMTTLKVIRVCTICGKDYSTVARVSKYCSTACRLEVGRRKARVKYAKKKAKK